MSLCMILQYCLSSLLAQSSSHPSGTAFWFSFVLRRSLSFVLATDASFILYHKQVVSVRKKCSSSHQWEKIAVGTIQKFLLVQYRTCSKGWRGKEKDFT